MNPQSEATAEGILYTDEYQLTIAQQSFRPGLHETEAQVDHFFRHYPDYGDHQAGYCINAGLEWALDWMHQARVRPADLDYLRSQRDRNGKQLFDEPFLRWLNEYGNFDAIS